MGLRYNPAIDGLRAIAVLAVVAYHAGLPVPAGFVGVDIFFVISGYLITRLLHDELQTTGRIDFMDFYARRARRIIPALAVVVAVTLLLSRLLLPFGFDTVAKSAASAAVFIANLLFLNHTGGYWSDSAETMPLLHLWSLSVEEQFYLAWPLLLMCMRRRSWGLLLATAVVSFMLAEALMQLEPQAAFYQAPARAWELAVGGLVALRPVRLPKGAAWVGLVVALASCFVPAAHFPGVGALPAVAGSALLIAGIQNGENPRLLTLQPMVFTGLISYSLYLWHWPLLALYRATHIGPSLLWVRLALCVFAFGLAWLSYRFVETPVRRSRVSGRKAVAAGVACLALVGSTSTALAGLPPPQWRTDALKRAQLAGNDHPDLFRCHYLSASPFAVLPKASCNPSGARVVIWGDSYALAWEPLAWQLAKRDGVSATAVSRDHCPPALGAVSLDSPAETSSCAAFNAAVIAYIKRTRPDTVILAARWTSVLPAAQGQTRAALAAIGSSVGRVLIVGPTPEMPDTTPRCIALGVNCNIPRKEFDSTATAAMQFLTSLPAQLIDVAPYLCSAERCAATAGDGSPLYWDSHHVSSTAANAVASAWLATHNAQSVQVKLSH